MSIQVISDPYRKGTAAGRFGAGIGQGLSEQVPKEIERYRLSSGLQDLAKNGKNLSPLELLAKAYGIPGMTPEMTRQIGEFARQQSKGNALSDLQGQQNQPKPSPFPQEQINQKRPQETGKAPSITKEEPFAKFQEGYIPPTKDEELRDAGQRYNANPALYNNDPQQAIDFVANKTQREKEIAEAFQTKHENLSKIQDNVVARLKNHAKDLGVEIPANVYSKIEDKAIQATKPKSDGGEGLTEQEAIKEFGKELDEVSREYKAIDSIGKWGLTGSKEKNILNSFESIREDFAKRNDLENGADETIHRNGLSPQMAYSIFFPVKKNKELNDAIKNEPPLEKKLIFEKGYPSVDVPQELLDRKTLELSKKIAPLLGDNGSPLAVAQALKSKGYNPDVWMDYITKNKKEFLKDARQDRETIKPRNFFGTFNDWWLSSWSGLE